MGWKTSQFLAMVSKDIILKNDADKIADIISRIFKYIKYLFVYFNKQFFTAYVGKILP